MVFTTSLFVYMFFPIVMLLWFAARQIERFIKLRIADSMLAIAGVLFFAWNNFEMIFWILIYVGIVYIFGLLIEQAKTNKNDSVVRIALTTGIILLVLLLGYYKYYKFTMGIFDVIFKSNMVLKVIATPLGISFLVFTSISYLEDIALNKAKAGNLLDCALYMTFFPKLISGPIVLWRDFANNIKNRNINAEQFIRGGIDRICIGFAKKLILADTFATMLADIDYNFLADGIDSGTAWLAVILYWLQIYYDFAGYSDIAIGLSNLFGFKFKENFNFPYLSKSIAEFWRRWHISLGTWFREYVYFPLGGSRKGKKQTILNLAIVFLLTGIWHGAGWNYLLWGAINGFFVIGNHLLGENSMWKKIPSGIKWFGTTLISMGFWELFRFSTLTEAYSWFCIMIGMNTYTGNTFTWRYYLDSSVICFIIIGVLGATLLGSPWITNKVYILKSKKGFDFIRSLLYLLLFVISIMFMVNSTYSPFIYFQY